MMLIIIILKNLLFVISTINTLFAVKNNVKDLWYKSADFRNKVYEKRKLKKIKKLKCKHANKIKALTVSQRVKLNDDNNKE